MATPKQAPRPDTDVFVDPVSPIYERLVDQIMANIAGHFDVTDATTGSVDWQLAKLAEVGALNKQNLETILRAMPEATRMTMDALEQSVLASLEVLEPSFAAAVKEGYLQNAEYPMMSPRVRDVLTAYQQQARNAMNLVNTTMLDSATAAYQKVIAGTVSRVNAAMSSEQTAKVLQMLNLKAGEVATGITSRRDALRQSLKELSDSGITGFVDKSGKTWNADTYINMNLRTTSGNVAMQATFARNADYGNDLISWPILANARPGCYPWQGKVCSTSNRSGFVEDLNGNKIRIYPLNQTTYGEPAGIGGINCHHKPPNIFIPGLSIIRGEVPPKKENDAGYENTQTQRALERKVRYARRDQAIAEASNDTAAAKAAEDRANKSVKELSAFTKQNNLTFRRDRIATQGTTAPIKRTPSKPIAEKAKSAASAPKAKESIQDILDRVERGEGTMNVRKLEHGKAKSMRTPSTAPSQPRAPKTISRAELEDKSRKVYIEMNKGELGEHVAAMRHQALAMNNSDAQLRDYIKRHGKQYGITLPKDAKIAPKATAAKAKAPAAPKQAAVKPVAPKPIAPTVVTPKPAAAVQKPTVAKAPAAPAAKAAPPKSNLIVQPRKLESALFKPIPKPSYKPVAPKAAPAKKNEKLIKTRAQLEAESKKVYIAKNAPLIGVEEATRRADLLAYANTAAQTRDFINKNSKIKVRLAKGVK